MAGKEDHIEELLVEVRDKLRVVDGLKTSVDGLTASVGQLQSDVSELKSDVGGLKVQVSVIEELTDAVRSNGVQVEQMRSELRVVAEGHMDLLTRIDRTVDDKLTHIRADVEALKIVQHAQTHDLKVIKADLRVVKGRTSRANAKIDLIDAKLDLKADKADLLHLRGRLLEAEKTE